MEGNIAFRAPFGGHEDTPPQVLAIQLEVLRRMTPEQRFAIVLEESRRLRGFVLAGFRLRHPEASEADAIRAFVEDLVRQAARGVVQGLAEPSVP